MENSTFVWISFTGGLPKQALNGWQVAGAPMLQRSLKQFLFFYNHVRTHESLGGSAYGQTEAGQLFHGMGGAAHGVLYPAMILPRHPQPVPSRWMVGFFAFFSFQGGISEGASQFRDSSVSFCTIF